MSYKIASAVIANRFKTILHQLIHEDQTGFISGRFIGENIRTLYDLMFYCEKQSIPGLLLLIDFEKAFDSLAWDFIYKGIEPGAIAVGTVYLPSFTSFARDSKWGCRL